MSAARLALDYKLSNEAYVELGRDGDVRELSYGAASGTGTLVYEAALLIDQRSSSRGGSARGRRVPGAPPRGAPELGHLGHHR